ncbi:hypothetical protein IC762_27695 [Bradyrhizobium genosp. L]|uniref:hypothetical protein n=1 Tax=Bradyrhizobium genosp. L TaxID=83637 RepID=UPI0018A32608|nr:hypothetical protein [Bradyrhizobium genosp. L]QPF83461.1 hypothetical protein IC762_27695 [Bradyrhizobium genosp. L]
MAKSFEIEIALDDLELLKAQGYLLCVAGAFGEERPLVVWRCFGNYLENNPFSLTGQFEVFATSSFKIGGVVHVDTKTMAIAPGQQTTFTADAEFQPPVAIDQPRSIMIQSQYPGPTHIGFNSTLTGPDNVQQTTPIFVSDNVFGSTNFVFMPLDAFQVWLQQNVVTSNIIDPHITNPGTIDLTNKDFVKLTYQNGKWSEQPDARPSAA